VRNSYFKKTNSFLNYKQYLSIIMRVYFFICLFNLVFTVVINEIYKGDVYIVRFFYFYNFSKFSEYPEYTYVSGVISLITIAPFLYYCSFVSVKYDVRNLNVKSYIYTFTIAISTFILSVLFLLYGGSVDVGGSGDVGRKTGSYLYSFVGMFFVSFSIWLVFICSYNWIFLEFLKFMRKKYGR